MNKNVRDHETSLQSLQVNRPVKIAGYSAIGLAAISLFVVVAYSLWPGLPLYSTAHFHTIEGITDSTDQFQYQPDRIEIGTLYHYTKSNTDGSKPVKIALYVASLERIEAFKMDPKAEAPDLVIATMDWALFSPGTIESYRVQSDGSRQMVVKESLQAGNRYQSYIANLLWIRGKTFSGPIGHYPVHNYNFDLASLNFTFRHLINPTQDFEIGLEMPCFDLVHMAKPVYLGKVTIHYLGEEACHENVCRKYKIGGSAFGRRQGYLWVNKEGDYFEKVEIPVPDNPAWKDFKLELTGIEFMDEKGWAQYILIGAKDFTKH